MKLKKMSVIVEFVLLSVVFVVVSSLIRANTAKDFVENVFLSRDVIKESTESNFDTSTYRAILNQVSRGEVSKIGLRKKVSNDNDINSMVTTYIYSIEDGFFPEIPDDMVNKLDPEVSYNKTVIEENGNIWVINSEEVADYKIYITYNLGKDNAFNDQVNKSALDGYVLLSNNQISYWIKADNKNEYVPTLDNIVNIQDYKLGSTNKIIIIDDGMAINNLFFVLSDEIYVNRVNNTIAIFAIILAVKLLLTFILSNSFKFGNFSSSGENEELKAV